MSAVGFFAEKGHISVFARTIACLGLDNGGTAACLGLDNGGTAACLGLDNGGTAVCLGLDNGALEQVVVLITGTMPSRICTDVAGTAWYIGSEHFFV